MMKLSQDERTVLKTGISKFKTLIFCVLFTELVIPQITFKGFCKLNSFKVDSGYTNIFSFNYDLNEYSDLLLFNPFNKKAKLFDGKAGIEFIFKQEITLPVEISKIEPIILDNGIPESYAFASRKSRSFGILKFSPQGTPSITDQLKFDYYPENISISKNVSDMDFDFLISGNSFNGLSIVSNKNNKLVEKKITDKTLFKDAHFIDFNADGFDDIVALNSVKKKIHMFFRNSHGDFEDLRQISFEDNILSIHVFDINYDSFKDIIISTTKSIIIYFGNSFAAYNQSVYIQTAYPADKFVYGDFNHDGFFDFNYLNIEHGIISTIFAKDFYLFYPEFKHKIEKGLIDIIPFFSKFVYGAAYLNQNGEINILSNVNSISDNQQLAVAIEPDLISSFDLLNNGINDIVVTDNFDGNIKFILRDAAGLPDRLYSIKYYGNPEHLITFSNSGVIKTFLLFSANTRLVEMIEVNFDNFTFKRNHLYAKGPIQDVIVTADSKNEPQILVLYSNKKKLNLEVLTKNDSKYHRSNYEGLTSNWSNPFLTISDNPSLGYWESGDKQVTLKFLFINDNKFNQSTKLEIDKNILTIISKTNQDYTASDFHYASLISAKENYYLITGEESVEIYSGNAYINDLRNTDKNQLFFGKNNSIFVADTNSKSLYEIIPFEANKKLSVKKIFSEIKLSNYIIQKLDQRKSHLIFTNNKTGIIEIRRLPK